MYWDSLFPFLYNGTKSWLFLVSHKQFAHLHLTGIGWCYVVLVHFYFQSNSLFRCETGLFQVRALAIMYKQNI